MPDSPSLLVDAAAASALCGIGLSTWWKLEASGKTPESIKLGRSTRWRRHEIEAWIAEGCPPRFQTEQP